jgi:hypothetical protein
MVSWKNFMLIADKETSVLNAGYEAFTAAMFQVEVFWVVTPCSVAVGYQPFSGPCCLHLQGEG